MIVLVLIHFKNVHAPRVVDREIDSRAALVPIPAKLHYDLAFKSYPDTRQELRDSLFLSLLTLLPALGVMAGVVLLDGAFVGKGRPALGACMRPRSEVDGGNVLTEGARLDKCSGALGAFEWAFACMRSRVHSEVGAILEVGTTADELASVWRLAGVYAIVYR
jgi:hypothetical protein